MSYQAYKFLHLLGIILLFTVLGGLAALRATSSSATSSDSTRLYTYLHGLALLVVLFAGFGLLARLELATPGSWPTWVWLKIMVWILMGAGLVALKRAGRAAGGVLLVLLLLGAVAAGAAIFKF